MPDGERSSRSRRVAAVEGGRRQAARLRDAAVRRHRRQRVHRRRRRTTSATSSRPSIRRSIWELNIWYHTLNCGMHDADQRRDRFSLHLRRQGRPGPHLREARPKTSRSTSTPGSQGVKDGRSYCGDGLSHLFDFKVNDVGVGEAGPDGKISQLEPRQAGQGEGHVRRRGAARAEKPTTETEAIRNSAARSEAVLARRAGPHRRHAQGAGRADRQRPAGRDEGDRRRRLRCRR